MRGNQGQSPIRVRVARVLPTFLSDVLAPRGLSRTKGGVPFPPRRLDITARSVSIRLMVNPEPRLAMTEPR
jgi:hypothetical protein